MTITYKDLNQEDFTLAEGVFCGREAILVTPSHSDAGWTKENLGFRSVIFDKNTDECLSRSFEKFFNYTQSPDLYPDPLDFNDWEIYEKIDGSTLILDCVDNQISMRTRGIFNYKTQINAADFELLFEKYPMAEKLIRDHHYLTVLWEIVTPNNRIVLDYGPEVDFYLIGIIEKSTGKIFEESHLDELAATDGFKRPQKYNFENLDELARVVKDWQKTEGVVVSYNGSRNKLKWKADRYCFLHKIMTGLRSKKTIVEKFIEIGCPNRADFFDYYVKNYDFEIATEIEPEINEISDSYDCILKDYEEIKRFVNKFCTSETRREMAEHIIQKYGKSYKSGVAFGILDNKPIGTKVLKDLLLEK